MLKKTAYTFLIVFGFFIASELVLRYGLGFCDTVLMIEDPDFEYIPAPNQDRFRFRNHIKYNRHSMRSPELDSCSIKYLFFGDSVLNGGTLTDQDEMATTYLDDTLSKLEGQKVQTLSISAGSWGPDNAYAYLKKRGDFNSKKIILITSSHDAYDNRGFEKIVDVLEGFPSNQYKIAWQELIERYILPKILVKIEKGTNSTDHLGINKRNANSAFNSGFLSFYKYTKEHEIPLILYLHAETPELKAGKYNSQGQEIIDFAKKHKILIIKDLDFKPSIEDYRDQIHLSALGHRKMAKTLLPYLISTSK